jgi:hypothetical protein
MNVLVPKSRTSNNLAKSQFDKRDFLYNPRRNEYKCPVGERAIWRRSRIENGLLLHRNWASTCPRCPIKAQCTTGDYRRIGRWQHEAVLESIQKRLQRMQIGAGTDAAASIRSASSSSARMASMGRYRCSRNRTLT